MTRSEFLHLLGVYGFGTQWELMGPAGRLRMCDAADCPISFVANRYRDARRDVDSARWTASGVHEAATYMDLPYADAAAIVDAADAVRNHDTILRRQLLLCVGLVER